MTKGGNAWYFMKLPGKTCALPPYHETDSFCGSAGAFARPGFFREPLSTVAGEMSRFVAASLELTEIVAATPQAEDLRLQTEHFLPMDRNKAG